MQDRCYLCRGQVCVSGCIVYFNIQNSIAPVFYETLAAARAPLWAPRTPFTKREFRKVLIDSR